MMSKDFSLAHRFGAARQIKLTIVRGESIDNGRHQHYTGCSPLKKMCTYPPRRDLEMICQSASLVSVRPAATANGPRDDNWWQIRDDRWRGSDGEYCGRLRPNQSSNSSTDRPTRRQTGHSSAASAGGAMATNCRRWALKRCYCSDRHRCLQCDGQELHEPKLSSSVAW